MQREKRYLKKVAQVKIEPYLAEYINAKYGHDPNTGGLRIPCTTDLYHCVWENMSRLNFELHRALLENEEFGKERRNLDVIYDFMRTYRLKSITEDALLKNYYRYRNRLRQKKTRKYRK